MKTKMLPALMMALSLGSLGAGPMASASRAQITSVDPNETLDADLKGTAQSVQTPPAQPQTPSPAPVTGYEDVSAQSQVQSQNPLPATPQAQAGGERGAIPANLPTSGDQTYKKDDLIGAAEGVFGKGAEGLGTMIENLLAKQGEPNGYIVGREASGALVVGLRYGSGRLFHKIEGERDVYWTGPSIGLDTGGNASRSFVLVYNLYDSQDLYKRFPAGEGSAYMVGGLTASYLRRGDIVLIPIRLGVGMRLGVNAGYMKFTEKRKWLPF